LKISASLILNLFIFLAFHSIESQNLSLKITGQDSLQTKTIDSIGYQKTFKDFKSVQSQIQLLSNKLEQAGYIELTLGELTKSSPKQLELIIDLKQKYYTIYIYNYSNYFTKEELKNVSNTIQPEYFVIPIPKIEASLEHLNSILVNKGSPFSTLKLQNIEKHNTQHLKGELIPTLSKPRTIDNIIVKGYEKFPKSYLKHLLKIKKGDIFNIDDLKEKTSRLQSLQFANELKSPEVLFSKDSTNVYLYIEKAKSNSFDGFLGFGSNEQTNKLQFDGYLNLVLVNNLNYGESLRIKYKSDEIDQQTFNINLNLPYLFSSPLGTELELNIFKRDSTFTTTKQSANLFYQITPNQTVFAGITSSESNNLLNTSSTTLKDYSSTFYNIKYEYIKNTPRSQVFPLNFAVKTSLGTGFRKENNKKTNQNTATLHLEKNLFLNQKNSFYIKSKGAILFSDNYLTNELFRFGGINSIRGFEENSIEANAYGVLNTEYRYLLSQNLYIHSIIDFSYLEHNNINLKEKLFGFGFGFGLFTKSGLLKFNYANGKNDSKKFKLSDSKIHLSLTATF
jgi:outer membrane protein assembly factor BamA